MCSVVYRCDVMLGSFVLACLQSATYEFSLWGTHAIALF